MPKPIQDKVMHVCTETLTVRKEHAPKTSDAVPKGNIEPNVAITAENIVLEKFEYTSLRAWSAVSRTTGKSVLVDDARDGFGAENIDVKSAAPSSVLTLLRITRLPSSSTSSETSAWVACTSVACPALAVSERSSSVEAAAT